MDGELQRKHGALSELPAVRSEPRPLSTEERQQKQAELNALQPEHCRAPLHRQKKIRRAKLSEQLKSDLTRGRAPRPLSAEERQQKQAELDALQPDGPLCRQARKRRRVDRPKNRLVEGRTSHTRTARPGPLSVEGQQQYTLEDHEWRQAIRAWSHEDAAKEANPCH